MNLFQNPFYVLGVSTRDSKQVIVEACDAKSLAFDADLCSRLRSDLTAPRNRLSAELAWLPGLSPARALGLIQELEKAPKTFLSSLDGTNPLTRCNALVTYLERHKPTEESLIINLLIDTAQSFEQIDLANLLTLVNEDRRIATISLVQDTGVLKDEMQNRRQYMIGVMKDSLNLVKAPDSILTEIVIRTTSAGERHPPLLIEELTDKYQIEVQKHLDYLVGQIENIRTGILKEPEKTFEHQMPLLYKYLVTWDQIAQPIQLIQQSKGIDDPQSKGLARDLRDMAIDLANLHAMHEEAQQITKMVAAIFKELPQFSEKVSEDLSTLEDILKRKAQSEEEQQQWREECFLDIEFGTLFKKRLTITPEIIRFKDEQIPSSEVSRVRWGAVATTHSVTFIPTGTAYSYSVWIGSSHRILHIEPPDGNLYNMIIERLWKAVCVRLISDTLRRLSDGEYISFGNGDAVVNKEGVTLTKHNIFGQSEAVFCKWEALVIRNGNGSFIIEASADKSLGAELSYRDIDNVHILETILRFLWKDGNYAKLRRGEFSELVESDQDDTDTFEDVAREHDVEQGPGETNEDEIPEVPNNNLIKVCCPACNEVMTVSLRFTPRGSAISCSKCNEKFLVPG
jgi:hypothetical protein